MVLGGSHPRSASPRSSSAGPTHPHVPPQTYPLSSAASHGPASGLHPQPAYPRSRPLHGGSVHPHRMPYNSVPTYGRAPGAGGVLHPMSGSRYPRPQGYGAGHMQQGPMGAQGGRYAPY